MSTIIDQILESDPFGQFDELELIGEGTFGSVLRARDILLDRPVALKIPHDQELLSGGLLSEPEAQTRETGTKPNDKMKIP